MSYETILEQIKAVPEECLDEIAEMITFILYRYEQRISDVAVERSMDKYFGTIDLGDGLELQRKMRSEWD
ncbi:MAG: hypothetical protein J6R67_11810 [Treponema sp.]|jgi:predicted component of type VI protein secretion system|nr:hypothetical protein [Treponema sp.]